MVYVRGGESRVILWQEKAEKGHPLRERQSAVLLLRSKSLRGCQGVPQLWSCIHHPLRRLQLLAITSSRHHSNTLPPVSTSPRLHHTLLLPHPHHYYHTTTHQTTRIASSHITLPSSSDLHSALHRAIPLLPDLVVASKANQLFLAYVSNMNH